MSLILSLLSGNDRRSIGKSNDVVSIVCKNEKLFDELFKHLYSENKIIRMRAADSIQKVVEIKPYLIKKYKDEVIYKIAKINQQEVRWHVAQLIPHLGITIAEVPIVLKFLIKYLDDESKIVKTFAMQALTDLTDIDFTIREKVLKIIELQMKNGSPAMLSRGKKLLKKLKEK